MKCHLASSFLYALKYQRWNSLVTRTFQSNYGHCWPSSRCHLTECHNASRARCLALTSFVIVCFQVRWSSPPTWLAVMRWTEWAGRGHVPQLCCWLERPACSSLWCQMYVQTIRCVCVWAREKSKDMIHQENMIPLAQFGQDVQGIANTKPTPSPQQPNTG